MRLSIGLEKWKELCLLVGNFLWTVLESSSEHYMNVALLQFIGNPIYTGMKTVALAGEL